MKIATEEIKTDCGTQMRFELSGSTVKEYQTLCKSDGSWPFQEPLVVFTDGKSYWLADGFHRLEACKLAGQLLVDCEIKNGTVEDAQDYALSANITHGLRRSNEDKKKAVEFALNCERWSSKSSRAIADHLGVSHSFVANARKTDSKEDESNFLIGQDGKRYPAKNDRQSKEFIPVVVDTPENETENFYEFAYQDESEPLKEGDIDCGVVEESQEQTTQKVDWKIKYKKTISIAETLIRAIDELNNYKRSNRKDFVTAKAGEVWEGLKKW